MRISELARQSGLPVATIKFYLREGLLPPGTPISRTQAEYSDTHLERLRLIRALRDIADLPVVTVGTVLAAVDDEELPLLDLLGVTQTAVAGFKGSAPPTAERGRAGRPAAGGSGLDADRGLAAGRLTGPGAGRAARRG